MDLSTWCLIVTYIRYWSAIDSLQWDVESTLEFDYERSSIPIGLSGPRFELIFFYGMVYEGGMGYWQCLKICDFSPKYQGKIAYRSWPI